MANKHIHPKDLAFAVESIPCVAPADWTAETAIEFVSVDISGVEEALVADPTAERNPFAVGERAKRKGIRNCTASAVLKLHGLGVVTADTEQVPDTYLAKILKHCLGVVDRGYSTTATGGTAAIPILDDVTNLVAGAMLAFQDTTAPTAQDTGVVHFRRVKSFDAMTKAVTLSGVLPFTPANGDLVHGTISAGLSHTYLVDAVAAGGLFQWYVKLDQGVADDDLIWTLEGCVASMKIEGLARGSLPTIGLDIMAANFRNGAGDGLNNVALGTREGHAQLTMGKDVRCFISPVGSTAEIEVDVADYQFEVGMTRKPTTSTTERLHRFEGLSSYHYDPSATFLTVKLTDYTSAYYNALAADGEYRITFYQQGDGTGAGKGWCIHMGKCRLVKTPSRVDHDMVHGTSLKFQACVMDDAGSTELATSRFLIALA